MKSKSFILIVMVIAAAAILPSHVFSQCVQPFEFGNWTNIDANTRGITRIDVDFCCGDQVLCSVDKDGNVTCRSNCSSPYKIHLWGACSPTACDWGAVNGTDYYTSGGTKWIYAFYDQGFAKRYVYIKPSILYPGDLYMWMYTDFVDPHRADYVLTNWFHH